MSAIISTLLLAASSAVYAQNTVVRPGYGVGIGNQANFCIIIPDKYGSSIAANDNTGVSACLGNAAGASPMTPVPAKFNAKQFFVSAHVVKTAVYKQVTGLYNSTSYGIAANDQGTQWDNSLAAQGGVEPWTTCAGYAQFLEYMVGSGTQNGYYALRCCTYAYSEYCNPSHDTQGIAGIPGNYGYGFSFTTATAPPSNPVPNYEDCSPVTDHCSPGPQKQAFVCCVGATDPSRNKTTCRPQSSCTKTPSSASNVFGSAN